MPTDKYDDAIEYLTKSPDRIHHAWNCAEPAPGGALFNHAGPKPKWVNGACVNYVGCLTEITNGAAKAITPELTAAIRADSRIPKSESDITVANLHVFAEWQRKIDAMEIR